MDLETINEILDCYFSEDILTEKEQKLLMLFYPSLGASYCDSLQAVYFILEYRTSIDACTNYNELILNELESQNGCSLVEPPVFQNNQEYFLIGKVKSNRRGCESC